MKKTLVLALCLAGLFGVPLAASTIHLAEAAWALGGPLTVDATGTDTDADEVLSLAELTSLTAVYDIAGGGTLQWDQADFLLGAFGIGALSDTYLFLAQNPAGAAVFAAAGGGSSSAQVSDARIGLLDTADSLTQVPEPASALLTGAGCLLLAALATTRRGWSGRLMRSSR